MLRRINGYGIFFVCVDCLIMLWNKTATADKLLWKRSAQKMSNDQWRQQQCEQAAAAAAETAAVVTSKMLISMNVEEKAPLSAKYQYLVYTHTLTYSILHYKQKVLTSMLNISLFVCLLLQHVASSYCSIAASIRCYCWMLSSSSFLPPLLRLLPITLCVCAQVLAKSSRVCSIESVSFAFLLSRSHTHSLTHAYTLAVCLPHAHNLLLTCTAIERRRLRRWCCRCCCCCVVVCSAHFYAGRTWFKSLFSRKMPLLWKTSTK